MPCMPLEQMDVISVSRLTTVSPPAEAKWALNPTYSWYSEDMAGFTFGGFGTARFYAELLHSL